MKGKDRVLKRLRFLTSREFEALAGAVIYEAADAEQSVAGVIDDAD